MSTDVTTLLMQLREGDRSDFDRLLGLVYGELQAIAHRRLRAERDDHTLNTTALVHEAYLKLVDQHAHVWQNRAHFFGAASQAMRRILVDYARGKRRDKRRGLHVDLSSAGEIPENTTLDVDELLSLDEALEKLEGVNPRCVRVVECRYFAGLSIEEVAEALGISHMTVSRDWRFARAWLHQALIPGS